MKNPDPGSYREKRNRLPVHLLFATLFVAAPLITYYFRGTSMEDVRRGLETGADLNSVFVKQSWIRFCFENFILCGLFYLNYLVLVPKLIIGQRNWWLYSGAVVITILLFTGLVVLEHNWVDTLVHARPMPFRLRLADTLLTDLLLISIGTGLGILQHNVSLQLQQKEKERALLESELKFLRSQINPHFLFNSLNNIYSVSITDPKATSDALLRLSSLLRFLAYESGKSVIALTKELEYIRNYVELESLRMPENMKVSYRHSGDDTGSVHPMLLIPFIENAFKHGKTSAAPAEIVITTEKTNGLIRLVTENLVFPHDAEREEGGIGLSNTRRRLELHYPEKHTLHISNDGRKFTAELKLELHEDPLHSN